MIELSLLIFIKLLVIHFYQLALHSPLKKYWKKINSISQNNHVEAVPKEKFGIFYDDCTYIIYAATVKGCIVNQYTIVSYNYGICAQVVR